jgi:hypothetical protein
MEGQLPRPIDIEMARITAFFAAFHNVAPPQVFSEAAMWLGTMSRMSPKPTLQRFHHAVEAISAANRRVDLVGVGNVISVGRT